MGIHMTQTISNIGGLIIDMDGVLWHGNQPLAGLSDFFATLRKFHVPFVLATNNASLTQQQYLDKLADMSVDVAATEILTSSMATARYLKENLPEHQRRVYVIGEAGLTEPLVQQGFVLTDLYQVNQPDKGIENQGADIVVSGLDRKLQS